MHFHIFHHYDHIDHNFPIIILNVLDFVVIMILIDATVFVYLVELLVAASTFTIALTRDTVSFHAIIIIAVMPYRIYPEHYDPHQPYLSPNLSRHPHY